MTASSFRITPCIWLDDRAEEAAEFYVRTLPAGRVIGTSRYPEGSDNPGGRPPGSVLTVEFEVAGHRFTALNGGPVFVLNPSISFFVHVETAAEADRLFAAFAEGGAVLMPIDRYAWSERYGWVQDRFGVSWQVMAGRREGRAVIAPCLMFAGVQHGRAEAAIRFYAGVFADSRVEQIEHYADGEGPPGTVKHGRFVLAGQDFVAMDSHMTSGISFNEALSLQVMCADQAELDAYWEALGAGGEHGPCGWLKDRFGVSWQVVPTAMSRWLVGPDPAARSRVFQAMLGMQKLDLAALERAFAGS
ncbi:MAG: VOC family protein [Gemmatimonadetes bacterium]|nr:VOC family protein [Gemmatimonadota bacterium]